MNTEISLASTGTLTKAEYDESQLLKSAEDELDRVLFAARHTQLQNQKSIRSDEKRGICGSISQFCNSKESPICPRHSLTWRTSFDRSNHERC